MRQIFARLIVITIFALVFVGFVPNNAHADVNDFSFSSFDADYYLSKDSEGHSTLKVVETLTAEFVNQNQNRGIERAVPMYYDGHSVSFNFVSMTRNGAQEPLYEQRYESPFVILSTRRNDYVNGRQIYTFTYTLRDVVKTFGDHQELYWDTNGTGWSQQFGKLDVRLHLDDSVKSAFSGAISCYVGVEGSKKQCESKTDGSVTSFSSNGPLYAGENLTYNLTFAAGTFVPYQLTAFDIIPYALIAVALMIFVAVVVMKLRYGRDNPGRGTIVPEYIPPKDVCVLIAAEVAGKATTSSTAQILDFAVRHKIKIVESKEKVWFFDTTKYTLILDNIDGLDKDELGYIDILFDSREIGSKYTFNKNDSARAMLMRTFIKEIKKESETQGYRLKQTSKVVTQYILVSLMFTADFVAIMIALSGANDPAGAFGVMVFLGLVVLIGLFKLTSLRPLTEKGRELFDYQKGLEEYIKLAEADRLKVLQSPKGAERKPVDTSDTAKMIVLYERVLPYAVLFGQGKEWLAELGNYYETNQITPVWYSGVNGFNAGNFVSSVSSFSSYADSSSFSSSSGAGGGGSSGGGGGGGGGGGV